MSIKLSLDSFLAVVSRSGLIEGDQLKGRLSAFKDAGGDASEARPFAEHLVREKVLTHWQADKLLQGKHKGFFLGKYRLLALLGKGGMSSVYLAEHVLMRRRCAIKVLPTKRVNDASYLGRFHREAQAVASLDHPNIVRAYDVDHEVDGNMEIHFLVMEYVEGTSLLDLIQGGECPLLQAAEYIRQAALGLQHAHDAGLVHRDIKPGNLLVDNSGVVKLLDLGLARFFAGEEGESLTIQHDEKVLGTADYLAPEQAVDSHLVDARADIYSLGCTLYFLLTGHPPFTQGTLAQRLMAHQTKEPPAVDSERKDVPESLLAILRKMMAKKPDNRYQSAAEVSDVMAAWLADQGVEPVRVGSGSSLKGASGVAAPAANPSTPSPEKSATAKAAPAQPATTKSGPIKPGQAKPTQPKPTPAKPAAASAQPRTAAGATSAARPAAPSATIAATPAPDVNPEFGAFLAQLGTDTEAPRQTAAEIPALVIPDETPPPASRRDSGVQAAALRASSVSVPTVSAGGAIVEAVAEPVAEAVSEAEPAADDLVALPVVDPPWKRWLSDRRVIGGGVVALVVAVAAVVVSMSGGDAEKPNALPGGPTAPTAQTPVEPPAGLGPEITVGPQGDLKSIAAAVAYVRKHASAGVGNTEWRIKVESGQTFTEGIVIDNSQLGAFFPKGAVIAASDPARPVLLKPAGKDPVIDLNGVERLVIEGFRIDAAGRDVAARLSGYLLGTKLTQLNIEGFERTGLLCVGARGLSGARVELQNVTFRAKDAAAEAIRFESDVASDTREWLVQKCRFLGPLQSGIVFTSTAGAVEIRECIFHELRNGVRFSGSNQDVGDFRLLNNTFFRFDRGIAFDNLPLEGSKGFLVSQNLFAEGRGPESIVTNGFDAARAGALLTGGGARFNWTDSAGSSDSGLPLFEADGRRDSKCEFVSTDPATPDFLKPADSTLRSAVTTPTGPSNYIGAVAP